jgi:hypothetical protein
VRFFGLPNIAWSSIIGALTMPSTPHAPRSQPPARQPPPPWASYALAGLNAVSGCAFFAVTKQASPGTCICGQLTCRQLAPPPPPAVRSLQHPPLREALSLGRSIHCRPRHPSRLATQFFNPANFTAPKEAGNLPAWYQHNYTSNRAAQVRLSGSAATPCSGLWRLARWQLLPAWRHPGPRAAAVQLPRLCWPPACPPRQQQADPTCAPGRRPTLQGAVRNVLKDTGVLLGASAVWYGVAAGLRVVRGQDDAWNTTISGGLSSAIVGAKCGCPGCGGGLLCGRAGRVGRVGRLGGVRHVDALGAAARWARGRRAWAGRGGAGHPVAGPRRAGAQTQQRCQAGLAVAAWPCICPLGLGAGSEPAPAPGPLVHLEPPTQPNAPPPLSAPQSSTPSAAPAWACLLP